MMAKEMAARPKLNNANENSTSYLVDRLLFKFFKSKKSPEDSILVHLGRMEELRNQLAGLEQEISEATYQRIIINSLPQEYAVIMDVMVVMHPDMRTTPFLVSRLLRREDDLKIERKRRQL